jgi:hypothetical protein
MGAYSKSTVGPKTVFEKQVSKRSPKPPPQLPPAKAKGAPKPKLAPVPKSRLCPQQPNFIPLYQFRQKLGNVWIQLGAVEAKASRRRLGPEDWLELKKDLKKLGSQIATHLDCPELSYFGSDSALFRV